MTWGIFQIAIILGVGCLIIYADPGAPRLAVGLLGFVAALIVTVAANKVMSLLRRRNSN